MARSISATPWMSKVPSGFMVAVMSVPPASPDILNLAEPLSAGVAPLSTLRCDSFTSSVMPPYVIWPDMLAAAVSLPPLYAAFETLIALASSGLAACTPVASIDNLSAAAVSRPILSLPLSSDEISLISTSVLALAETLPSCSAIAILVGLDPRLIVRLALPDEPVML